MTQAAVVQPERLRHALARVQRERLQTDAGLVLGGHLVVMTLITGLLWTPILEHGLTWWISAVAITTVARAAWQRYTGRSDLSDDSVLAVARILIGLQGQQHVLTAPLQAQHDDHEKHDHQRKNHVVAMQRPGQERETQPPAKSGIAGRGQSANARGDPADLLELQADQE